MSTTLPDHDVPTSDTDTATADGEGNAAAEVGQLAEFPVESLVPHPDNPRGGLGDLTEGSGFHLMRGSWRVVGWGCCPWSLLVGS